MAIVKVLLGIPDEIRRGLQTGELVRAGGVVRHAPGTSAGGNIRMLLNEAGPTEVGVGAPWLPEAALGVIQLASVAYLANRLDRVEEAVGAVRQEVASLARDVEHLARLQQMAWTKEVGKGRVFTTLLGHRNEVWTNPLYQQHLLGGLAWALKLEEEPKAATQPK